MNKSCQELRMQSQQIQFLEEDKLASLSRQLPEYLTKCFSSKIEQEIENALILAKLQGFTVEEIKEVFQEWKQTLKENKEVNHGL